jgi:hypothetical protein
VVGKYKKIQAYIEVEEKMAEEKVLIFGKDS